MAMASTPQTGQSLYYVINPDGSRKDFNSREEMEAFVQNYNLTKGPTAKAFDIGVDRGKQLLTNDPRMQEVTNRMQDISRGYTGQEMGALRGQARAELQGQRSNYLRQLASRTGRAGVGGARAAAMQGAADKGFMQSAAEQERKMTLDNAQLIRSGTKDVSDFLLRQRLGELATGAGFAQLSSSDRAAEEQRRAAANQPRQRFLGIF